MDSQIEELKELMRQNIALAQDTNRTLHKIRRGAVWSRLLSIAWWLIILGTSAAAYYYYFQPHLVELIHLYQQMAKGGTQAQTAQQQLSSFFGNILPKQ